MDKYKYNSEQSGLHSKILGEIGSGNRILEIGCAGGYMSSKLQKKGNYVTAIEINPKDAKRASKYCKKVIVGDIEDKDVLRKLKNQKFDVILLADILEHLKNPQGILLDLSRSLTVNGQIIISVPNIAFLTNRLTHFLGSFEYTEWGIIDKTHLKFFTKKTALELITGVGLKVKKFDCVGGFTQLPLFMKIIFPVVGKFQWWKKVEYRLAIFWPEGLAYQFLFICQ